MYAARTAERDRRKKRRFPISRELRYRVIDGNVVLDHGTGETINMSSGGIWFIAGSSLRPGAFIELSISWPVVLGENTLLRLVMLGRVVRISGEAAACTIDKYEFRTQARSAASPVLARRDNVPERTVGDAELKPTITARERRA